MLFRSIVLIILPFAQSLNAARPSFNKGTARREAAYQRQINNRQKRIANQRRLMARKVGNTARRQKIVARHERQISYLNNLKKVASSPAAIRATKRAAASDRRAQAKSRRQLASRRVVAARNTRQGRGLSVLSSGNSSASQPRTTSRSSRGRRSNATSSGGNQSSGKRSVGRGNRSSGKRTVRAVTRGSSSSVSRPRGGKNWGGGKNQPRRHHARPGGRGKGGGAVKHGSRGRYAKHARSRGDARLVVAGSGHKRGRGARAPRVYGPRRAPGRHHHGDYYARSHPRRRYTHYRRGSSCRYHRPYYHRYHGPRHYHYYDSSFLRMYYGDYDFYFGFYRPSYSWYRHHCGGYYPHRTVYIYGATYPTVIREYVAVSEPEIIITEPEPVVLSTHEKLMGQLLFEQDEKRLQAAKDLGEYKDISTIAALTDVLINDANYQVRAAAAESLGQIEDSAGYEALLRSAAAEQSETVRNAAEAASGNIEQANDHDDLYVSPKFPPMNNGKEKLGTYMEQLRFGPDDQRKKAAKKLEDYPGTQTVAALINALVNDSDKSVRKEAAHSLGKIGDRMPLPFLDTVSVDDPEKSVRKEAEEAIKEIHDDYSLIIDKGASSTEQRKLVVNIFGHENSILEKLAREFASRMNNVPGLSNLVMTDLRKRPDRKSVV